MSENYYHPSGGATSARGDLTSQPGYEGRSANTTTTTTTALSARMGREGATAGAGGDHQNGIVRFHGRLGPSHRVAFAETRRPQVTPTPPINRSAVYGGGRQPRLSAVELPTSARVAVLREAATVCCVPSYGEAIRDVNTSALPSSTPSPECVVPGPHLPRMNIDDISTDGNESRRLCNAAKGIGGGGVCSLVAPPTSSRSPGLLSSSIEPHPLNSNSPTSRSRASECNEVTAAAAAATTATLHDDEVGGGDSPENDDSNNSRGRHSSPLHPSPSPPHPRTETAAGEAETASANRVSKTCVSCPNPPLAPSDSTTPTCWRSRLARSHGIAEQPLAATLTVSGTEPPDALAAHHGWTCKGGSLRGCVGGFSDGGTGGPSDDTLGTHRCPPHLQTIGRIRLGSLERSSPSSTDDASAWLAAHAASGTSSQMLPDRCPTEDELAVRVSLESSSTNSVTPRFEEDATAEVAEACHQLLLHLPEQWGSMIARAVTLQVATTQVPPRFLRSQVIFDAYAELKGEIAAASRLPPPPSLASVTLAPVPFCGRESSRAHGSTDRPVSAIDGDATVSSRWTAERGNLVSGPVPMIRTIHLQRLLTVAPMLLRYRLHNTCTTKVAELRASLRGSAPMEMRTAASINRYAYVPHVQRDVHFGAVLTQGVTRMMMPGPRLLCDAGGSPRRGVFSAGTGVVELPDVVQKTPPNSPPSPPLPASSSNSASAAVVERTCTYATVSFEGFPSIFLKDRHDVAQMTKGNSEKALARGDAAGNAGRNDHRNNNSRRRRRIIPFFEREFVATLAVGQEDAAFFTTTLTPELMVGLPSFMKHPERAVPLSLTAALHYMYSAVSVELFLHCYSALSLQQARSAALVARAGFPYSTARMGQAANTAASPPHEGSSTPRPLAATREKPSAGTATVTATTPPLRGPPLELGMAYVRNTIVCTACTPGMEAYLLFLHEVIYPDRHSDDVSCRPNGVEASARAQKQQQQQSQSFRAIVQLSEDANGTMAPPPPSSNVKAPFSLPTLKHAAVELTQLVSWVQDTRSHDPRHGQPFLCQLTFAQDHIPDIANPTTTQLCQPQSGAAWEDPSTYPCAVVLATLDVWKALPPSLVSNLLRLFFVLDRHAQRVMELESPDYAVEDPSDSGEAAAVAASSGTSVTKDAADPFPDPQLRERVATTIPTHVRAYLEGLPSFREEGFRGARPNERFLSFFMARLHYYEALSVYHNKTEEMWEREELLRMARQRTTPKGASSSQLHIPSSSLQASTPPLLSASSAAASSLSTPIVGGDSSRGGDVYGVAKKPLCDALAMALAVEARIDQRLSSHHRRPDSTVGALGDVEAEMPSDQHALWRALTPRHTPPSAEDSLDHLPLKDGHTSATVSGAATHGEAPTTASVVVLLVPQRDAQRR